MSEVRLYFKSSAIRDDAEFLCLTDMWRAAEAPDSKRPAKWLETEASQEFVQFIADSQGVALADTLRREHGNPQTGDGGATWAHWQLGMAYAKYLSPAFHAWCNDVVRKVMRGDAPNSADVAQLRSEVQGLTNNLAALWRQMAEFAAQVPIGGAISAARFNALTSDIYTLADVELRIGKWTTRRAALADIRREIGEASEWGGKGRPWNEMPAASEPIVRSVLRRRMKDATRRDQPRQLALVQTKTGTDK